MEAKKVLEDWSDIDCQLICMKQQQHLLTCFIADRKEA